MKNIFLTPVLSPVVWAIHFWFVSVGISLAGDATFSRDGQHVYLTDSNDNKSALREIDLSARTSRVISLTQLGKDEWITGVAASSDDTIFLATRKQLWRFDPRSQRLSKVREASKSDNFYRIAFDPKSGQLFLTTDSGCYFLHNGRELATVYVRRHPNIGCPVFAANGELFFCETGDLWHGLIAPDEFRSGYSLTAYRYAPLGALETANTTPAETGVRDIAVTSDTIYLQLGRMGGSGYGWMAELPRPKSPENPEEFGGPIDPTEALPKYDKVLQSVKIMGENSYQSNLCVSPDETRVYYTDRHGDNPEEDWLVTKGKAEQLHLKVVR